MNNSSQDRLEVSLGDILRFFKRRALLLVLTSLLGGLFGYGISFLSVPQFQASVKILPEYDKVEASSLSDLASLAGISIKQNSSDAIRPSLYPQIIASRSFLVELMNTSFPLENGKTINLLTFLDDKAKPLSKQQIEKSDTIISLSKDQERVLKNISSRIIGGIEKTSGIVTITFEMPDPVLAASCASFSVNYISNLVQKYRFNKNNDKLIFTQDRLKEAKIRFRKAEIALNSYKDKHINTYSNLAKTEEQKLQLEFLQSQSLFTNLSQQYELSKLQTSESKPVFQVLEPPSIPNWKSKPRRLLMAISFSLIAGVSTLALLLARLHLSNSIL